MRILFFINDISCAGGSERATTVLANKLASKGYEVYVLSWMGGSNNPFFKLDPSIKVFSLYSSKVNIYKNYLGSFIKYLKIVRKIRPNYIIDVCTALSLLSLPLRFFVRFKLISWEHFNTSVNWNAFTSRLSRWMVSHFANHVVVLTQTDRQNYERRFGAKNIITLSNPSTINHQLRANLNSNIVLSIGRFTPQKGFDLLLKSWKIVNFQMPHLKLHIVGDGELSDDLQMLSENLGIQNSIVWFKPTSNIEDHYKNASLYVMSSRFEGLPFVLIEAKSFGLPIISFDCDTGPREIIRNQVDGILVPKENIKALASEIITTMKDLKIRQNLSENALKDMGRFDLEEIFHHWTKLIK